MDFYNVIIFSGRAAKTNYAKSYCAKIGKTVIHKKYFQFQCISFGICTLDVYSCLFYISSQQKPALLIVRE